LKLEARLRSGEDLVRDSTLQRFQRFATGELESAPGMNKPYDIAARHGLVAITDSRDAVAYMFDLQRRRFFAFGWRREGKLEKPAGIAIDNNKQVYIADSARGKIIVYDAYGLYLREIGTPDLFDRLSDVAVSSLNNDVFALDRGGVDSTRHRVTQFDSEGKFKRFIGERGHGEGQFNHPNQVTVSLQGDLVVLDAGNFRVQVFDSEGKYKSSWAGLGRGLGQLARPRGLALTHNGLFVISDTAFQNVQFFNSDGQLLLVLGNQEPPGEPGRYLLPSGVASDEKGFIYIVDQALRSIDVWRLLDEDSAKSVIR